MRQARAAPGSASGKMLARFARDSPLEGGVSCEPVSEKPEIGALSGLNIFQIAPLKRAEEAELEPSSDLMFFKLPP
jgi:hypothetical protein